MRTRVTMTVSSLLMGLTGIALIFLPDEIGGYLCGAEIKSVSIIIQILGALYFAFGMVNWTAKGNLIGGIYARPIAIGNLTHFAMGALALVKAYASFHLTWLIPWAIAYMLLALLFAKIFMTHPVSEK